MRDTFYINGKVFIENQKSKDTLITYTISKNPNNNTLFDSNIFKTLLPVGISLFIFFLGQLLIIYFKKNDKKKHLQNSKETLQDWVTLLENNIDNMVENCQKFSNELSNEKKLQKISFSYYPTLINKISELDISEFMSFTTLNLRGEKKKNADKAFKIINEIEFMKSIENDILKKTDIFYDTVDDLASKWNTAYSELDNLKLSMFNEVGSDQQNLAYNFSHQVNDLFNSWMTSNIDYLIVTNWKNKMIPELTDLIKVEFHVNAKNTYPSKFYSKIRVLSEIIINWQGTQSNLSELIKGYGESYKKSYNDLHNYIIELKSQNLVYTWRIK